MMLWAALCLQATAQTAKEVQADFQQRFKNSVCTHPQEALKLAKTPQERDALQFLYAYMDWPDVTDYAPQFMLDNARLALQTRTDFPWGKQIPDREWLHFVLPVRVNNEHLDSFRIKTYEMLRKRVRYMNWHDAALEVNHWCHSVMTYRPSDARTSSPLASMRTTTGRCGEESTLAVSALRAVGIPARQVYTPRWAHTDDNHAWVEAYVDGKWQFLGACEPAAELNIAWFNQPAARGMLMNTTVMGRYQGDEQILQQYPLQTTINVTNNYAPVERRSVRIVDERGRKVRDAKVRFGLYNYAEFYTLYSTQSDARGEASLICGKGDLLVWAAKDGRYGFAKVSPNQGKHPTEIRLTHKAGDRFETDLTLTPPPVSNNYPKVSPEAEALNNKRLAQEDAQRMKWPSVWPNEKKVEEVAEVLNYDAARLQPLFKKSEGNFMALYDVLEHFNQEKNVCILSKNLTQKDLVLYVLESLTDKDLRDFDERVIINHIEQIEKQLSTPSAMKVGEEDFQRNSHYVLCPRISTEDLTPWREELAQTVETIRTFTHTDEQVAAIMQKLNSVKTDTTPASRFVPQAPVTVLSSQQASATSKGICFVAMCRTLGIPARRDEVTSNFQYWDGEWKTVDFGPTQAAANSQLSKLALSYSPRRFMENPSYYSHFSLSRLEDGLPKLQGYDENATWAETFKKGVEVEHGDYLLTSGTRLADGSVLCHISVFSVAADTTVQLVMREDASQVSVIGSFNAENIYHDLEEAKEKSVLSTTGRGYFIVGLLKANNEPSTHILHDIEASRAELESWGRAILMLFPTAAEYDSFMKRRSEFPNLPKNLRFGIDSKQQVANDLFGSGLTQSPERPVVIIGDTFNRVVFFSQGYTIGMGQQLTKTIGKL